MTISPTRDPRRATVPRPVLHVALKLLWRLRRRPGSGIDRLPDHVLRDIGLDPTTHYVIAVRRDRELRRLFAQAAGGPFFVPPA